MSTTIVLEFEEYLNKFPGFSFFNQLLQKIAHNVPAVCDGLAARIRALRSKDRPPKCARSEPWERSDLGERNPKGPSGPAAVTVLLYDVGLELTLSSFHSYAKIFYSFFYTVRILK
jgi:hypothetical protein